MSKSRLEYLEDEKKQITEELLSGKLAYSEIRIGKEKLAKIIKEIKSLERQDGTRTAKRK